MSDMGDQQLQGGYTPGMPLQPTVTNPPLSEANLSSLPGNEVGNNATEA